jgi:hypothetical protein
MEGPPALRPAETWVPAMSEDHRAVMVVAGAWQAGRGVVEAGDDVDIVAEGGQGGEAQASS